MKAIGRFVPPLLVWLAWRDRRRRPVWLAALGAAWTRAYRRHERIVRERSDRERRRLGVRDPAAVLRALESRPPGGAAGVEATVRRLASDGLTVVVGSDDGSLLEMVPTAGRAVGVDLSATAVREAAKSRAAPGRAFVQGDGARLPVRSAAADLVVLRALHRTVRPEHVVWEAARALRTGGRVIVEAPNACARPSASPLTHAPVWLARIAASTRPWLVPGRRWTDERPIAAALRTDPAGPEVWTPNVAHVAREIEWLLRAAGFRGVRWRAVGAFAGVPGLRRLGPRLHVEAVCATEPVAAVPPLGLWRGSEG